MFVGVRMIGFGRLVVVKCCGMAMVSVLWCSTFCLGFAFTDQYKIPRKFIQGLDKAAKPGKKK